MDTKETALLYHQHHSWLLTWLNKKLANTADAADIMHDTFIRVLTQKVTEIHEPRAYLVTIAKGLVVNNYKRKLLEQSYLEVLAQLPEQQVPSAEQRYVLLETLQEIDAMLDTLPGKVREAFLLSQLEGLNYQQIADKMQISLMTVKRHMKRAFLACLIFTAE